MHLNFVKTLMLMLVIIYEKKSWKNAKSFIGSCTDKKRPSTFIDNFVGASEIITDHELLVPMKHFRRQLAEAEIKSYATILITSAVIATLITFICLMIILHIFIYMRWGITRQLILLNAKVCALESRLGTRQLPEELQRKLCEEIGITLKTIQNERQKFAQEIVNEERKIVEEVVKSENDPQYETMCGIGDEVFTSKKASEKKIPKPKETQGLPAEKQADDDHYENIPKRPATEPGLIQQVEIKAPEVGGMVDQADPKYQTLIGMDNEKVFVEKKAATGGGVVDQADPAYQTLAGMENEKVFQEKGKGN